VSKNIYNNQESLVTGTPFLIADQYELRQRVSETVLAKFFYANDLMSVNEGEQENTLIIAAVEPSLALYPGFEQIFPRVLAEFTRSDAPVQVVDACQSAGVYWIVFQANKGQLLSHHLKQAATHPLQSTQTQTVLIHILRAVKHIAPQGGFGFIEPDAILYDGNSCQFLNAPLVIMLHLLSSKRETHYEKLALHSPYISPEVAQGLPPIAQDDSFSIACIAYQLLQGTAPFAGLSSLAALTQHKQPAPLLHLKSETRASLQRALSLHRVDRQASAYELVHAFTEIPTDSQQTVRKITPMRRRSILSIGAIAVAAVAGYAIYSPNPVLTQVAQIQTVTVTHVQEKIPDKSQPMITTPENKLATANVEKTIELTH
jgi:serine/threonine protein kinase